MATPLKNRESDASAPRAPLTLAGQWRTLFVALPVLTLLTGVVFPLAAAGVSRLLFADAAGGSLIERDGRVVGSRLVAQAFSRPDYFHPRPSAAGAGYDAASSGGTNLGPAHPKLRDGIADDPATPADESFAGMRALAAAYRRTNGLAVDAVVPIDAVTRSGSGLDPHISPENAALQRDRVARVRGMTPAAVGALINAHTQGPLLGVFGRTRVAVLELNLALDAAAPARPHVEQRR